MTSRDDFDYLRERLVDNSEKLVARLRSRLVPNPDPLTPGERLAYVEAHIAAIKASLCPESSGSTECAGQASRHVPAGPDSRPQEPESSGRGDEHSQYRGAFGLPARKFRELSDRLQSPPSRTNVPYSLPPWLLAVPASLGLVAAVGMAIRRRRRFPTDRARAQKGGSDEFFIRPP